MIFEPSNFLFPNDLHVHWSLMIVMYPYVTGLVAGAFIVSSLFHVFEKEEFRPVARIALLTSLAFLLVATTPLLLHLGHPERAMNIMLTPHFSSAMAGFGIIYNFYLLVVILEIWLVYRKDIVEFARTSTGLRRRFYKLLALGVYDVSEQALKNDHKAVTILAAIGIPSACFLHGYVGFLFGGVKANPWWSTPLMPVIFLFSAVVSGIAALVIIYQVAMKARGEPIDAQCIAGLVRWLWLFMIMSLSLEILEIITLAYERAEEWEVISVLLTNQLSFSFISLQMIIGGLIPFILLMITVIMDKYLHERLRNTLAFISASLLLLQVFSMRWNVVIGGQIFSKSFRGFRDFHPHFLEKEGILTSIAVVVAPCVLLYIFNRFLPAFKKTTAKLVLVFVSMSLLFLFPTRSWAENACVNCHQRLVPTVGRAHNFGEWEKSLHAQKGVTCEKCHGGDPTEEDPIKAHQSILKPHQAKSPLYYSQIPETCGACHTTELQEFRKSAHYQELKKSERGPNCVTCHASMAIGIPQPGSLEQTCSVCHRERQIAKEALVTLNLAGSALKRWEETFESLKKRGKTTPGQEELLKGNRKSFTEVQKKWHAFSMKDVVEDSKKIISAAREAVQNLQPAKGEQ